MAGIILTDVDGTVLDFMSSFENWIRNLGIAPNPEFENHYHLSNYLGLSDEETRALIEGFFSSSYAGDLEPIPDALDVLPRLHRKGWRFVAITACPEDSPVVLQRRKNLEDVFGIKWDAVHCIGLSGNKAPMLNAYRPTIWVEDHWGNAHVGMEAGHDAFLLDRPHNRVDTRGARRVPDWHAIEASLSV